MRNIANRVFVFALGIAFLFAGVAARAATPMLASGGFDSLFLNSDGSVWGTGRSSLVSVTSPVRQLQLSNVVSVAGGQGTEFALLADGTLWGVGGNNYGQLGDGTTQNRGQPQRVPGLSGVTAVAVAGNNAYALTQDGTVWAWGSNSNGQLGDGTQNDRSVPGRVTGLANITKIAAGGLNALALHADGTVWMWGSAAQGSAGDGVVPMQGDPGLNHLVPTQVHILDQVTAISLGFNHQLALRSDGTVWTWGTGTNGANGTGAAGLDITLSVPVQIPGLDRVVAIDAAGNSFSLALKDDGTVWAWGINDFGQLGVSGMNYSASPIQVPGLTDVVTVAAGRAHGLAMRRDGTVLAWGANSNSARWAGNSGGQLGDNTLLDRAQPGPVAGPGGTGQLNLLQPAPTRFNQLPAAQINLSVASGRAPLTVQATTVNAIDPDGTITAFNWKTRDGQQATGQSATFVFAQPGTFTIDLLVADNTGASGWARTQVVVAPVAAGSVPARPKVQIDQQGAMALTNDGRILTWGRGMALGLYDTTLGNLFQDANPLPMANGITGAVDFSGRSVLLADGTVLAWGGASDFQPQLLPNLPPVQALGPVVDSILRNRFALTRDGRVFVWGQNDVGQLGLGDDTNRSQPVEVTGFSNVAALVGGRGISAALKTDGTVWAWGDNSMSQLGDGTTTSRNRPIQVPGLLDMTRIFPGFNGFFAQMTDGTVWATGTLPFTPSTDVAAPGSGARRVPDLDNALQIAGSNQHIVVVKTDGTVWTGGSARSYALGFRGAGDFVGLRQLPGISDAISVSTSPFEAIILRRDGTVFAWGLNNYGQIGDGTLAYRQTPVLVVNETGDGFLDLIPEVPNIPYSSGAQPFFSKVASDSVIDNAKPTITNTTKFNAGDVGKSGSVFVMGAVPRGTLATAAPSGIRALRQLRPSALEAVAPAPFVLVQLIPSGWQEVVNGQLLPYASGVLGDQLAAHTILSNTDTTNLKGAQFCVGYGTSANEMTAAARMKIVVTIPDPDATGASTVSCIVQSASVAASDSDGDRKSDILWRNTNGQVAIWLMNGMAPSSGAIIATVGNEWKIAASGDFDGDGKSDILWRNSNGQVAMWLMSGMAQESSAIIAAVSTDWTISGTGDFDGDGKSDILWRNTNGQVAIWLMSGMAQKSSAVIAVVGNEWKIAASGDFDGDGKSDILWRNTNGQVAIWLMNGMAMNSGAIIAAVSTDWTTAGTGDFNGDGKADILWRNVNGEGAIWLMNGMAQQSAGSLGVISNDWKVAASGDFDGDGKSDILWRNDNGQVAIWLIDGAAQKSSALLGLVSADWRIASGAAN